MDEGGVRLRFLNGDNVEIIETNKFQERRRHKSHEDISLPTYTAIIPFFIGFMFFGAAYFLHYNLPSALSIKDISENPDRFIAERALNHLRQLTSFGSKPVGSYENEVLAVEFLTREIRYIMQKANSSQKISFDLQKCTGSYTLAFKPHGFINYYSQVQNIVVKLDANSSSSLLINCHFDSVPTSPGASDDGLNCAVMLEVLEILSQSKETLKHNIIFLFNGAEESPLQASHGFITQHKWAPEVKAFINLEACGAGGREVLFQAGPHHPWLLRAYGDSVPHPHAQVLAEDIFQSGLVPSDTDFRVFRDFANIPGVDFAHAMNGYVYHTSYDSLHAIPAGTLQHTGDNLLALVKHIASSDILSNTQEYANGRMVFYDIMGLFLIRYSEIFSIVLNICIVVISIYSGVINILDLWEGHLTEKEFWKPFLLGLGVPVLGWIVAAVSVLLIALVLDLFNSTMSWFTRPYFIFFLYYCPVILGCMAFPLLYNKYHNNQDELNGTVQARLYINGVQLLWGVLLLVGTALRIRSTFIFMLLLLFPALSNLILSFTRWRINAKVWLSVYTASTLPFSFLIMYYTVMAFGLFVPITGRIGPVKNPDIIIGVFGALLGILSASYVTQLIVLLKRPRYVICALGGLLVGALIAVILTPVGFPYSANPSAPTPQRIHIFHTERTFHDIQGHVRSKDSGYWLLNLDHHSPSSVISLIPEVAFAQPIGDMCEKELVCGLPLFSARILQISDYTHWIPVPSAPVLHFPTDITLTNEAVISETIRRMNFTVKGPDRMTLVLSPSANIFNWSFDKEVTETGYKWQNRSIYYVNYAQGLTGSPFQFWIDLEVTGEHKGPVLDVAVIGHYINNHGEISEDFINFLKKYPDWAHVTAWSATYKSWQF